MEHEPDSSYRAGRYSLNKCPHRKDPLETALPAYTVLLRVYRLLIDNAMLEGRVLDGPLQKSGLWTGLDLGLDSAYIE